MNRIGSGIAAALVVASPAIGDDYPDCSAFDLAPGIICEIVADCPWGAELSPNPPCALGVQRAIDNDGHWLSVQDGWIASTFHSQLIRWHGTEPEVLADTSGSGPYSVTNLGPDRCAQDYGFLVFDPVAGAVTVGYCINAPGFDGLTRVFRFTGLTPLFEVMQSYQPGQVSFAVPPMPEGFTSADRFDAYWLDDPRDLSAAHPLACDLHGTAGQRVSFTDASPTPAPGDAVFILTRVSSGGQTRAGRRAAGGHLTGRTAGDLPVCSQ